MIDDKQSMLRMIPKVDRLMMEPELEKASRGRSRQLIQKAVNQVLDEIREKILSNKMADVSLVNLHAIIAKVIDKIDRFSRPSLQGLINATGVVVHTNLGRSILAKKVLKNLVNLAGGYSNLEYDLKLGKRGSRYVHVEEILKELTFAEAAMVVNNNAAAVLLSLDTIASGKEVVVSRGQLVEIGGSFRIPEVMRKSGAKMVEVGTTNKTHLRDYEEAINESTALLLKVHTSNYQIIGFTKEVPLSELAALGQKHGIPVMEDLGSGCFIDFSEYGLGREPTVQEVLAAGADLVTFSGDKLLGGPQAGIILGRKDLVESIRKNHLTRALRIDKMTLLALEETLRLYRDRHRAMKEIPTLRMIACPYNTLAARAERLIKMVGKISDENFSMVLTEGYSRVGGGALPALELPSRILCLVPSRMSASQMEILLRKNNPPIIARVEKDRVLLDVRTIRVSEMKTVADTLARLSRLSSPD
ncbi:MAG: L-seryl-tRNA(Sec) selenium transferase [Desulfobacteraceae bacterium]|jgi:L-seryl-tRNA(Ser) seleniumtransferase|nr:MAG: L-seryl-tRNA(Sec) selenium transferase [Desulfobacteraceae bacterium]